MFFIAMYCPEWTPAVNTHISTNVVSYGTVATVFCDDGYMFPDGSNSTAIGCTINSAPYVEAVWNVTQQQLTSCLR